MRFCYRTPLFPEPEGPLTEKIELTGTSGMVKEETENFFLIFLFNKRSNKMERWGGWQLGSLRQLVFVPPSSSRMGASRNLASQGVRVNT